MGESIFLELTKDFLFKTLWYRGDKDVRKYLERMVEYAIGHPIGEYNLGPNELGVLTYKQIAQKTDVLLVSSDKTYKINVEMNRIGKENSSKERIQTSDNKSDIYLGNYVANFYNDLKDTYITAINVEQVNFNAFYCPENKLISRLDFEFVDLNYMIVKNNIKSHLLYLPRLRDLCYNQKEEKYKDYALLMSTSYEEMERIAKGDKEREAVVAFVKRLGADKMFINEALKREYERVDAELAKKEAINEAVDKATKEALEQGIEQGIEQGEEKKQIELIKSMYANGASVEFISNCTKIPIKELKSILKIEDI